MSSTILTPYFAMPKGKKTLRRSLKVFKFLLGISKQLMQPFTMIHKIFYGIAILKKFSKSTGTPLKEVKICLQSCNFTKTSSPWQASSSGYMLEVMRRKILSIDISVVLIVEIKEHNKRFLLC